jgi:hypothetical protein
VARPGLGRRYYFFASSFTSAAGALGEAVLPEDAPAGGAEGAEDVAGGVAAGVEDFAADFELSWPQAASATAAAAAISSDFFMGFPCQSG